MLKLCRLLPPTSRFIVIEHRRIAISQLQAARKQYTPEEEERLRKEHHSSQGRQRVKTEDDVRIAKIQQNFGSVPHDKKTKETFKNAVGLFLQSNTTRRGHVEFIYGAMKHLKDYGLNKDINTYKQLLDLFPKGRMVPQNRWQRAFMHFPRQQYAALELLDMMGDNHVCPDLEIHHMMLNAFGQYSRPDMKIRRMMYWMPKAKYANPFDIPRDLPDAAIDLARMAIKMMSRDPGTDISTYATSALPTVSDEDTWIVSGQSVFQKAIIAEYTPEVQLMLQGPFTVWVRDERVQYFQLLAEPDTTVTQCDFLDESDDKESAAAWKEWASTRRRGFIDGRSGSSKFMGPKRANIHQQKHETILGLAATGTTTKSSAAAWLAFLQRENPKLEQMSVQIQIRHRPEDKDIVATE